METITNNIKVENIQTENFDGHLGVTFDVIIDGEKTDLVEWIDLDDGLLIARGHPDGAIASGDYRFEDEVEEAIFDIVNDYLSDNPISEKTLQSYRDIKDGYEGEKASDEDQEETEFEFEMDGEVYSVRPSNETAYVNSEFVVWYHVYEVGNHYCGQFNVPSRAVEYYGYQKAIVDHMREIWS